jgi:cytochrome c553
MFRRRAVRLLVACGSATVLAGMGRATAETVDFSRDVQPLFARRCVACHGPETREAGLRLDDRAAATRELASGGRAIAPGNPGESGILARVTSTDPDVRMPPDGPRLSAAQVESLRSWIAAGADWPAHWAFRPVEWPAVPPSDTEARAREGNPIDAFIAQGLTRRDLPRPPPAARAVLLRRATYSVTGLPPTEADMRDFLADESPGAWERVVDRLLASPHYGEHWARHWLDLVRYADTNSFERDGAKPHAWRYRDYVIRSFNDDKPYDRFLVEQVAGDELPNPSADALVATGWYRLGIWDDEPADPLQSRYDWLDDLVSTTGQAFLGLTINCARCHDHKIDPLPQRDYYALLAFFQNVTPMGGRQMNPAFIERTLPEEGAPVTAARDHDEEFARRRAEIRASIAAIEKRIAEHGEQALDDLARQDLANWKRLLADVDAETKRLPKALVVTEHGTKPPETFVLFRGNPHAETKPEHRVEPGFPSILGAARPEIAAVPAANSTGRRTALASWLTDPANPLVARVMANRVWQHHFGRGIVKSASNFGLLGDAPTHPELLDWLASEFVAGGWRLKRLHKLILMSEAFRAAATGNSVAAAKDPLNDAFWRFDPRRLAAEELRDSIHVASGAFNPKMFGPGVFPDIPAEVKAGQSRPGEGWGTSPPGEQARRSIYIHAKRSLLTPLLADFDLADTDTSCPVRFTTTQPTQALGMMNGSFLQSQARTFAARARREALAATAQPGPADDDTARIVRRAIESALVRPATDAEVARGVALVDRLEDTDGVSPGRALELYCLMILNTNEFAYLD